MFLFLQTIYIFSLFFYCNPLNFVFQLFQKGSYYDVDKHKWGYSCCWQLSKNSFCVGEDGKQAIIEGKRFLKEQLDKEKALNSTDDGTTSKKNSKDGVGGFAKAGTGINHANAADKKREERPDISATKNGPRSDGWDRDNDFNTKINGELNNDKLKIALKEERKKKKRKLQDSKKGKRDGEETDRPTGFGMEDESIEVIEAKRLMRERSNDPMALVGDSDELLPLNEEDNEQLRQTA